MGQMVVYENETGRGVEYSGEIEGDHPQCSSSTLIPAAFSRGGTIY